MVKEKGEFKGINYLTGQKIYLTKEEEKIIKKQQKKVAKVIWIIVLIIFALMVGDILLLAYG